MVAKCPCFVFVLLSLGQLVQSQFGKHEEVCKAVCKPWEGDYLAENTICRRRYKKCLETFFINFFEDKGNIAFNAITRLSTSPEPCKHVKQGTEIKGTLCRTECDPGEKQLEFVPLEVCGLDLYCCEASKQICGAFKDDMYKLPYLKTHGARCLYNCMLNQTSMLKDNGLINVENVKNLKSPKTSVLAEVAEACKYHRHLSENTCETAGLFMECTARELISRKIDKLSMANAIVSAYKSL